MHRVHHNLHLLRAVLIAGGVGLPLLGLWALIAHSLQDGLIAGVLAGMVLLGSLSLLPRHGGHDGHDG